MKTLFLNRHAKSSWKNHGLRDHDRPLNKRGKLNAPFMATKFAESEQVDLIVSSSARRALNTAKSFAKALDNDEIQVEERIYGAGVNEMMSVISDLDPDAGSAILFGHNPTFSMLAHHLDNTFSDHLVTCALVKIEFQLDDWKAISRDSGKVIYHHYPRLYDEMKDL